jgi:IS30 family transposase
MAVASQEQSLFGRRGVWFWHDTDLPSQAKLSAIARQLNERPRKTLLYQTPAEKFAECVAAIG